MYFADTWRNFAAKRSLGISNVYEQDGMNPVKGDMGIVDLKTIDTGEEKQTANVFIQKHIQSTIVQWDKQWLKTDRNVKAKKLLITGG